MPKRWPAVPLPIRRLHEATKRVRIYGKIVAMNPAEAKVTVDDGTAATDVFLNSIELLDRMHEFSIGDFVLVIGWPIENGIDCEIMAKVNPGEDFNPHVYIDAVEVIWNVSRQTFGSDGLGESP